MTITLITFPDSSNIGKVLTVKDNMRPEYTDVLSPVLRLSRTFATNVYATCNA